MDQADLLVIGGGIVGAGVARDAAGRGLSVVLCERDDLAQHASSRSTRLVHGGLRCLEHYEFRIVREALIEREALLRAAPHVVWPLRFVLPGSPEDRPAWRVRLGLFLYDHLGGRKLLPPTRKLDLRRDPEGVAIRREYGVAYKYSDCWVDDARLVTLNAVDARERGAEILTRTACVAARVEAGRWRVELLDRRTGARRVLQARAIVNASGPWVNDVIGRVMGGYASRSVRLVKGSHIVTAKFWDGPHAYLLQNHDRRGIFVLPYEGDKALIGTTDIPYAGRAQTVAPDESEIAYLLAAVNRYFRRELKRADVLDAYAGVRPLIVSGKGARAAAARETAFDLDETRGPPALSIFGGNITTVRRIAEQALDRLKPHLPEMNPAWTRDAALPGGDIAGADFDAFLRGFKAGRPWLPDSLALHYARLYGTRALGIVGRARGLADLGRRFGPLLYEAEVRHLQEQEWAETADDIVLRRTKHHLTMSPREKQALADTLETAPAPVS